jgi:CRP-like cAMP-binding protein
MRDSVVATVHSILSMDYSSEAFALGALSASSLLLGSILGVRLRPPALVTSALTAFGAGALLAALSVELVAATVLNRGAGHAELIYALLFGAICGGLLFVALDSLVSSEGGYLRKTATTLLFLGRRQRRRSRALVRELSRIRFLRKIPPQEIQVLVNLVRPEEFPGGAILFQQGDEGDKLYFIEKGQVQLTEDGHAIDTLDAGDVVGEIALLTGARRTAEARASGKVVALSLSRADFQRLRRMLPELDREASDLAAQRLEKVESRSREHQAEAEIWYRQARQALSGSVQAPSSARLRELAAEKSNAPLAIWLGILLDGIPESLVIGAAVPGMIALSGMSHPGFLEIIPWTLIAGLFLSNFPEALSSSVGMKAQGWSSARVIMLWLTTLLVTALGAYMGYFLVGILEQSTIIFLQGLAAGAMLTMIAQTMIPEAVHIGSPAVSGLSTLAGFFGAVAFKLLE